MTGVPASTSLGESAYFLAQGSASFSNYFWTHVFNGLDVKDAFVLATTAVGYTTEAQHPLLDADGDAYIDNSDGTLKKANEGEDFTLARVRRPASAISWPRATRSATGSSPSPFAR